MKGLRIVNYAVNGSGVGHLTRLVAINRWIRRYTLFLGWRPEIYFLTTSEAEGLLLQERFASFKLPSKTVVDLAGMDKRAYLALAKQWVWHSLGLLRPDLLVVDTFPRGSFGELLSALDLARQRALVYRPVKDEFAGRSEFQSMLPLYDALLVPAAEAPAVPPSCADRLHCLGPVASRERFELVERSAARRAWGIPEGKRAVYVSAGGGGDSGAVSSLESLVDRLLQLPHVHLVVGAGPLYRGRPIHRPGVTWLQGWGASENFLALDLAVTAAGYNTCVELWQAGVPALFLPQEKVADDQAARARLAAECGAGQIVADPEELGELVERWAGRESAREAARSLMQRNWARDLAAECLRLVLPPGQVDAAQDALDDSLLARFADPDGYVEFCHLVEVFRSRELSGAQQGRLSRACRELFECSRTVGVEPEHLARLAQVWSHKLDRFPPWERASALAELLGELSRWGNWNAAVTILRLLLKEPEMRPAELARILVERLRGAASDDPYVLVQRLSERQGAAGNRALLESL